VTNNVFTGTGRLYPAGEDGCVSINSSHDNTIANNDCSDGYGGGISIGPGPPFSIAYVHGNNVMLNNFHDLGKGVIADFGCVYVANGACSGDTGATCGDLFQNNVCHDITHALDYTVSNGGTGIYLDHYTQNVTAANNLVYRTSGALVYVNHGCYTTCPGGAGNIVSGNVLAHTYQEAIKRGSNGPSYLGDSFLSFTFQNNIVYFDNVPSNPFSRGPQWLNPTYVTGPVSPGTDGWTCFNAVTAPCNRFFFFQSNDYWSPVSSPYLSTPVFYVTDSATGYPTDGYETIPPPLTQGYPVPFTQWQDCTLLSSSITDNICEDKFSIFSDPLFVNPDYPYDQYQLQVSSPAPSIGFNLGNDFLPTYSAGRNNPNIFPSAVAPGFPVQLLLPSQF
jgi:hypothetical protein